MTNLSRTPMYNLSAVLKETGLKADVLRAWERRYELPVPQRTPGRHRLYSEYDIQTVKWLRERQAEGISISRAVELWKRTLQAGRDPFADRVQEIPSDAELQLSSDTRIENLRKRWLEACLAFDGPKAEDILNQAFTMHPVETVCTSVLQQGMNNIGQYWYLGKATVQQEHFISSMAIRRLDTLITATPLATREQTILMGCPSGEWHTFSLLMLNLFLRRKGYKVVYLGADVPLDQMEETAAAVQPDLIVLSVQQITTAVNLQSVARLFQARGKALAYGGLIFNRVPGLRERIPAHFLGEGLEDAIRNIERLVAAPAPFPTEIHVDEPLQALVRLYMEKRPGIELALIKKLQEGKLPVDNIDAANTYFGNSLYAALMLGDPAFLEIDLDWVSHLFSGQNSSEARLFTYLGVYKDAVNDELGEVAAPFIHWISSYLSNPAGASQSGAVPAH